VGNLLSRLLYYNGIAEPSPCALVAASPQAPIADLWRDDGWHNGAFFLVANFGFYPGFTNRQDDKPTQRRAKGRLTPVQKMVTSFLCVWGQPVTQTINIIKIPSACGAK
jgi:predicted acyl esterase